MGHQKEQSTRSARLYAVGTESERHRQQVETIQMKEVTKAGRKVGWTSGGQHISRIWMHYLANIFILPIMFRDELWLLLWLCSEGVYETYIFIFIIFILHSNGLDCKMSEKWNVYSSLKHDLLYRYVMTKEISHTVQMKYTAAAYVHKERKGRKNKTFREES